MQSQLRRTFRGTKKERMSHSFYKETSPLNSLDRSWDARQILHIKNIGGVESTTGRVPIKYVSAYPEFFKPAKHHPYRRLNDTHVEKTMQSALKRVESDIKNKENEKILGMVILISQF